MIKLVFFTTAVLVITMATEHSDQKEGSVNDNGCGLAGRWKNSLNATVIFSCKGGQIEGKHMTGVGNSSDSFALSGRYTLSGPKHEVVVLGWTVSWDGEESATSWNGIHYPDEEVIHTMWIFTRYVERRNLWTSSLIYYDKFIRV